jgi:Fe-S-cluster-containing dehydrogenase component
LKVTFLHFCLEIFSDKSLTSIVKVCKKISILFFQRAKEEQTHHNTEEIRKKAEQLEKQNQLLQHTVLVNKKRLELEAHAANQVL